MGDISNNFERIAWSDPISHPSGFFQESRGSNYQATLEPGFASAFETNNVALTTVGIHNYQWLNSYRDFRNGMISKGVNIHALYKKGMRWHSKIFILSKSDIPVFSIIGSSNITRNAFSDFVPFNNECDVVLWTRQAKKIGKWFEGELEGNNFPFETIRAPYDRKMNFGLSIEDRLNNLKEEILGDNLAELQ